MLSKRIIPCLDIKDGKVVKGKQFIDLEVIGDPVELASKYNRDGADEICFLDINASYENRKTLVELVKKISRVLNIPFSVGGGIKTIEEMSILLSAGADKVCINSSAVMNPELIKIASNKFGSQSVVVAIDVKRSTSRIGWDVFIKGGREQTNLDAINWAKNVAKLGAGEILLTSMDKDGTAEGFDTEITYKISESINLPVIASGGAGMLSHFKDVIITGKADAVLTASLLHKNVITIQELKKYLQTNGIEIRK